MADISVTSGYDGLNLPYSPEAEQSVLGAVLLDSSCLDRIAEILPRAEYFHLANHRMIYDAMLEMFTLGQPVDFVTVLDKLKQNPAFDQVNGKTYLLQLAQIVPSVSNVETYAGIVRDKYDIRTLITTARDILEEASEGGDDAATLLDSAEQRIFDIRRGKNMQGLQRINEVIIETFDRLDLLNSPDSDQFKSISTGIRDLDETITGLNRSDLILLAARPGMGKTSFALNVALNVAKSEKKTVAMFSLEMSREQLATRLLSSEACVENTRLVTGSLRETDWEKIAAAAGVLNRVDIRIDDNPMLSVADMNAKCRRIDSLGLVVIDYLQLMTSASGGRSGENRQQVVSEMSRMLKVMAKELNVPVICLSQLSRANEKRDDKRPMLSDLRESGAIEQDADIVMFLYRDDYYNEDSEKRNIAECIVAKNRHGETGKVELRWMPEYTTFATLENRYDEDD